MQFMYDRADYFLVSEVDSGAMGQLNHAAYLILHNISVCFLY